MAKSKANNKERKQYSPKEVADKLGISPQAVIKKVNNTLDGADSNCLPDGLTVERFHRMFIIYAEPDYKFPRKKASKKK